MYYDIRFSAELSGFQNLLFVHVNSSAANTAEEQRFPIKSPLHCSTPEKHCEKNTRTIQHNTYGKVQAGRILSTVDCQNSKSKQLSAVIYIYLSCHLCWNDTNIRVSVAFLVLVMYIIHKKRAEPRS